MKFKLDPFTSMDFVCANWEAEILLTSFALPEVDVIIEVEFLFYKTIYCVH